MIIPLFWYPFWSTRTASTYDSVPELAEALLNRRRGIGLGMMLDGQLHLWDVAVIFMRFYGHGMGYNMESKQQEGQQNLWENLVKTVDIPSGNQTWLAGRSDIDSTKSHLTTHSIQL